MSKQTFEQYLKYEKNYSSHTIEAYLRDLSQFKCFVCQNKERILGDEIDVLLSVDLDFVRNWVVSLMEGGLQPNSVKRKISSLRTYYYYLMKEGLIKSNPAAHLPLLKSAKPLPYFVKPSEMDRLLDHLGEGGDFIALRDKLIFMMFYETGMRRAELIGLRDADVDSATQLISIIGKRNKQRFVPFGEELLQAIVRYREVRSREVGTVSCFFVKNNGEPLYPTLVYRVVQAGLRQVCTLDKISPHVLRHTFASAMLSNGAGINSVKELLGHSSLSSTQIYTHISVEELKKSYQLAHPRGGIDS